MRRERGFDLITLVLVVAALGIIAALTFATHHWWEQHNEAMVQTGRDEVTQAVAKRDESQRLKVAEERKQLADEKAATEAAHAAQLKEVEDAGRKKLADAKNDLDNFVADVNAGRLVWRQQGAAGRSAASGSAAVLPEAATVLGVCAGLVGGGTVPSEALPLLQLACAEFSRADRLRTKLSAARGELAICTGEGLLPQPVK